MHDDKESGKNVGRKNKFFLKKSCHTCENNEGSKNKIKKKKKRLTRIAFHFFFFF